MAGFAHAGDDDAALRVADEIDRRREGAAQPVAQRSGERVDAAALGLQRAQRGIDRGLRAFAALVGGQRSGHAGPVGRLLNSTPLGRRPNVNGGAGLAAPRARRERPPARFAPRRRRCGGALTASLPSIRARSRAALSPGGSRMAATGLSGFQCHGLVGPKMATVGVPIAAETCIRPESLVTDSIRRGERENGVAQIVAGEVAHALAGSATISRAIGVSFGPPRTQTEAPSLASARARTA